MAQGCISCSAQTTCCTSQVAQGCVSCSAQTTCCTSQVGRSFASFIIIQEENTHLAVAVVVVARKAHATRPTARVSWATPTPGGGALRGRHGDEHEKSDDGCLPTAQKDDIKTGARRAHEGNVAIGWPCARAHARRRQETSALRRSSNRNPAWTFMLSALTS